MLAAEDLANLAVVDHDAVFAAPVVVRAGRDHRIDFGSHLRGGVETVGAVFAVGQITPELGGVGNLDFGDGVDEIIDDLLPGDGEDGLVQIVSHFGAGINLDFGAEQGLLAIQQICGFVQKPLQGGGVLGLAIAFLIRLRSHQCVLVDPEDFFDGLGFLYGIADFFRDESVIVIHQTDIRGGRRR